ncbi:MAG TPA: hypothetical protein VHF26_23650 [Trebonia sp.]|nr:hypothetical protein [Trebonia sp.]
MSGTAALPDVGALRAALVGRQLPGGTVRVEPYEAWLGHEAMGAAAPRTDGLLDPLWILVVALRGMGTGISGVIELGRLGPGDSVLFGGLELEQEAPLRTGSDYRVRGEITGVERHQGRRAGVFDEVTFALEISDCAGTRQARAVNRFLFRRAG